MTDRSDRYLHEQENGGNEFVHCYHCGKRAYRSDQGVVTFSSALCRPPAHCPRAGGIREKDMLAEAVPELRETVARDVRALISPPVRA